MQEVIRGVHTWSCFSEEKQLHFNGFHVQGPTGSVVIDPPAWTDEDLAALLALPRPAAIILTNKDHVRRSGELAERTGAPILAPEADAGLIAEVKIAATFGDATTLEAGVVTRHLVGMKSPGETALHLPWIDALVLGDALIGKPPGAVCLLPAQKVPDRAAARASVRRLLELRFDALLLADGAMFPAGGRAAIEAFLAAPDPEG